LQDEAAALYRMRRAECGFRGDGLRRRNERVRDLERLLGRKTMENEILKEALELARAKKAILLSSSVPSDGSR